MERVTYDDLAPLVLALSAGATVVMPTDTVYGLACRADDESACRRLLLAKGRDLAKPSAVVAGSVASLPLSVASVALVEPYLPGAFTLIVPNELLVYPWLCGATPERIGVRVPGLEPRLAAALDAVGPLLLTSANRAGEPPAVTFGDAVALGDIATVGLDGGACPLGVSSRVIDLCGPAPVTLR